MTRFVRIIPPDTNAETNFCSCLASRDVFRGNAVFIGILLCVEFEDFIKDELKFAVVREDDSKEHLTEHIKQQAQ